MRLVMKLVMTLLTITQLAKGVPPIAKPYCKDRCGDIMIPYPFGIDSADCYKDEWFKINCTNGKPFLPRLNFSVLNITFRGLNDNMTRVTVEGPIKYSNCPGLDGGSLPINLTGSPFYFSGTNIFVAVGCNTSAFINDRTSTEIIGCNTGCTPGQESLLPNWPQLYFNPNYTNPCNGSDNCCQISSPDKVFNPSFQAIDGGPSSRCSLAFIADYNWVSSVLYKETQLQYVPFKLSWDFYPPLTGNTIGCFLNQYGANGTLMFTSDCVCSFGYEGNPYLGCTDIDECKTPKEYRCRGITNCVNTPGSYKCVVNPVWIVVTSIAGVVGMFAILFGCWWAYKSFKKRSKTRRKKKFFKRNGGLLLQQQVASIDGSLQKTKIFNSKELEKATDNFNKNRILGQGGQGTVYKGMLIDGRIVAVKKSTLVDEENLQEFINEVVLLSQINHRNVVKLLGCCLETEVPLLVYEFIPNGTLFQYIHDQQEDVPFSWEMRLQIATEAAGAVAYLHWAASIPIYHRDIKSTNILLDEKFRAKVSDFGTSRSIAVDQTHLTTQVQGTMGYLDPEYFQSGQFTAKSDVYSFGVVLLELLSGQKPISWVRSEESRSLATYFTLLMEENKLFEIVDISIMQEKHKQQIIAVANLAKRCLNLCGRFRPNMKEVAIELEHIRSSSTTEAIVPNANPSVVSCEYQDSMSLMSFEVEPLISNQTW